MSKKDFLENLFNALNTGMSKEEIYSHIRYYDEYIESEKKSGLTEEEVTARLGSPRLIAKTILDAAGSTSYAEQEYTDYKEESNTKVNNMGNMLQKIKKTAIVVLVVIAVLLVLWAGVVLLFRFIIPIVLIVAVVKLVKKLLT